MERKPTSVEGESVDTRVPAEQTVVPNVDDYLIPEIVRRPTGEHHETGREHVELKQRILDEGGVTIEPLEGDPFVLSRGREKEVRENAVTTFHPDGTTSVETHDEYEARLAQERVVARYFNPKRNVDTFPQTTNERPNIAQRFVRALKKSLKNFWSNLWK